MANPAYFPEPMENPNFISRPPDPGPMKLYRTLAQESLYHSPFSGVYRFSELLQEKQGDFLNISRTLSPDDANRLYGLGGQLKFDEPIEEGAASLMMRRKIAENDREYVIGSGMTTGFRRVAGIGVGMAATLLDPINTASMFVPVVGEARFARMVARFGGSVTKARLVAGAIEGAVGSAMVEPFVLLPAMQEQANYGLRDSALNLAYGAGLGSILHAGFGAIGDRLRKIKPHEQDAIFEAAMNNVLKNEPVTSPARVADFVEPEPEVRVTRMEMGGKTAVQVDVIVPGEDRPIFSGTPEQARAAGYTVPDERETIASAAIKDKDGKIHTGKNHPLIAESLMMGDDTPAEFYGATDGFVTSTGRFVDREEAARIAEAASQIQEGHRPDPDIGLSSEITNMRGSLTSQHLDIPANRSIDEIPRRGPDGRFLSKEQRLDMLHAKIESERTRAQSQVKKIDIDTKTDTSRLSSEDMRNTTESDKVANDINSEADELEKQIGNRVSLDDADAIDMEALKQQIKDEVGNPAKREAGVRAGIECIIKNLI